MPVGAIIQPSPALQLTCAPALADIAESATGQLSTYEQDVASVAGDSDAAQTSFTQFQLETKFNRAEMIAALADLQDDSNAFISLASAADEDAIAILHANSDEGLPPAAQRFRGRYKGLLETFHASLKPYKDSSDTFINVPLAVATLANVSSWEEVDEQDRSSEALFQLANVTELLTMTMHNRAASSLEIINTDFPTPFFREFSTSWGTSLSDSTVEIALGIRTQYIISLLHQRINQPNFEPDYALRSVFFDDAGGLLALELTDDDGASMRQSCRPLFEQRIQDIRVHFSTKEPYVNLEALEASFPWSNFRTELVQWAVHRATGLNMQITTRGGAKALQIHLQGGPPTIHISEKKRKSVGDKARQVNEMLAVIQANKARRETLDAQREELGGAQIEEIQESPLQVGTYQPATNDAGMDDEDGFGHGDVNLLASQQSMQVLETLRLHAAQSNKENLQAGRKGKFIDRQAGAQRVNLIDESPPVNGRAGPSRKRGREVDIEDDASSVQYEEDTRPLTNKRVRNHLANDDLVEAAAQVAVNAQMLSHAASQPMSPRQARDQPPASSAPQIRQHQPAEEDIPDDIQPIPATQGGKGPQVRVPFTVEESARLIDLIANLPEGTTRISWSHLEKEDLRHPEGPLLQKRGQVGLKDKARNLKMDFLK